MHRSHLFNAFLTPLTLIAGFTLLSLILNAQEKGTISDTRDGHVYSWLKIGKQTWMTENLRFSVPAGSWAYNNMPEHEENFGRLYSWNAARTACPKGWHLPSEKEWSLMIKSLGGSDVAGLKMQSMHTMGLAHDDKSAMNKGSVSTLLSGIRYPDGTCLGIDHWGGCWSSGQINDTVATNVLFAKGSKDVVFSTNDKNSGFLVRCIRNK